MVNNNTLDSIFFTTSLNNIATTHRSMTCIKLLSFNVKQYLELGCLPTGRRTTIIQCTKVMKEGIKTGTKETIMMLVDGDHEEVSIQE